jgi:hypothetical protein
MNSQTAAHDHADTVYVRTTVPRMVRDDGAARGYFQSSADLARGLEICDSPLGTLSPELIRAFLELKKRRLAA